MRTRVKVCGITCAADARAAVEAGADALGFVFAGSPRRVSPRQAGEIVTQAVPPFVAAVGVFVDEPPESVADAVREARLSAAQLHGAETPDCLRRLRELCPARLIKAVRVRAREDVLAVEAFRGCCDAVLLDAFAPHAAGGTGRAFDWDLALSAAERGLPIILAGGLTPENVAGAVRRVRPWAVDVSSGVESSPGRKDPDKIRAFIAAVRAADGKEP